MKFGIMEFLHTQLCWWFILLSSHVQQNGVWIASSEVLQEFEISEGVPIGTRIGFIGKQGSGSVIPPYLIVPVPGSSVDTDLIIDHSSGEIRTKIGLDRETRDVYSLVAIPSNGENIRVIIRVRDVNDNAPEFPSPTQHVEFPENTPRDVKRTLQPARDTDLGIYNVQRYTISAGNVNNAFRLSSHRERDGILYLDLQVNGFLDRETTPFYNLLIEAFDGGIPPLKGSMTVQVAIQDVNDYAPEFSQSRYFATISENATVGTKVLQVFATDTDAGVNGQISYSINRRQSDKESIFTIDKNTGVISINRPLDFESKEIHELVVMAKDNGAQPLETTVFVSIRVINVNVNQPVISIIFLTDDGTPRVSESANPGEFVARISVVDSDSKQQYTANTNNVTLQGGHDHFALSTRNGVVYVVVTGKRLDRETKSNYTLIVTASDIEANPPLNTSTIFTIQITDVNDNKPNFQSEEFHASVLETAEPGTSVFQITANDADLGNNSIVTYHLKSTPDTHSHWFQIDNNTGLISTKEHIDCEVDPTPRLVVVANDHGSPSLSSSATVFVRVMNVKNEPIFDHSFYNVSVPENTPIGKCILKVDAMDPDCGVNAMVNYKIQESTTKSFPVTVISNSGEICISGPLDFEERNVYEVSVVATDTGGLSSTTMVKIHITDLNDNRPAFPTLKYNISIREGMIPKAPIVSIIANDLDSGKFGQISYEIVKGNEAGKFHISKLTGEVFVQSPLSKSKPQHILSISATDGAGLISEKNAELKISVVDVKQQPPVFQNARYTFSIDEDVPVNSIVGTVVASGAGRRIRYTISSGDPYSYFTIDAFSGEIKTASILDHEKHPSMLLNVQAVTNEPYASGHCQVEVKIRDVNDWAPKFETPTVTIWVPENTEIGTVVYAVHAKDLDSGENGHVEYFLVENPGNVFSLDQNEGRLGLAVRLDYEKIKRYTLMVGARDNGSPPKMAPNLTVFVEVQDINDCEPHFEQDNYVITVSEALPVDSHITEVNAIDEDTGNNARLSYSLSDSDVKVQEMFGIVSNTGILYLKSPLDRETKDVFLITVVATDHGSIPLSSTALVTLHVGDENDNGPEFTKKHYQLTIEENNEPGVSIGSVTARDKDEGENGLIRYYLQPSHTHFQIDPNSGIITASTSLNREKHSYYELQVVAIDQGRNPKQAEVIVQINVRPLNNSSSSSSKFQCQGQDCHLHLTTKERSRFHFKVYENVSIGHLVGTVNVSELMGSEQGSYKNGLTTYAIVNGNTDASFEINRTSGAIFVAHELNYEDVSSYSIQVQTLDNSIQTQQMQIIFVDIDLYDVNDERPKIITSNGDPVRISVSEDARVGSVVWNFTAIDLDDGLNGVVHYSIVEQGREEKFRINALSGVLFLNSPLDYEEQESFILVISVTDQAPNLSDRLYSKVTVRVSVVDENDNFPTFVSASIISLWDSEPLDTSLHTIIAVDEDSNENGQVKYSITSGNEASYFSLNESSGELSLMKSLKGIDFTTFLLNISASDHGIPSKTTSQILQVTLQEMNKNPPQFAERKYDAKIQENSLIGTEVIRITAFRRNQSSPYTTKLLYKIPDVLSNGKFTIHPSTGSVTVADLLDRESQSEHVLTIYVHDGNLLSLYDSTTLVIKVTDMNDERPNFRDTCTDLTVPENHELGIIHTFTAWDNDLGRNGEVTYSIVSGNSENMFSIDFNTGRLTSRPLDRERRSKYQLLVVAQDQGLPVQRSTCNLTIYVQDENDNTPEFVVENQFNKAQYVATIAENVPVGTTVLVVEAKDADVELNSLIKYSLSNESHWHFAVDNLTGAITTKGVLDREKMSEYSFEIMATDGGLYDSRSAKAQVKIFLTDVNTQKPLFSQNPVVVEVSPNTKAGQNIVQLKATDSDKGMNGAVTYSIEGQETRFRVHPQTGVIAPMLNLSFDRGRIFHLNVLAKDQGIPALSSTALVVIQVGEVSVANTLTFQEAYYEGKVSENSLPGTEVIQVTALKKDGRLHRIRYSVVAGNEDRAFEIIASSGLIRVGNKVALDRERNPKYSLVVAAQTDSANNPLYATALVNITLMDENDNYAIFSQNSYVTSVWEGNNKGTFVTQVRAHDDDEGSNANLVYHIVDGNHDNAFVIDPPFSGIVKTNIVLDREIQDKYRLTIIATDEGLPQLSGTCLLYINVIDVNDNSPHWSVVSKPGASQNNQSASSANSVVSVVESLPVGSLVTTVVANDVDTNPALVYTFTKNGNPNNTFSIGKYTGRIVLSSQLDYEQEKTYQVQVEVSDSVHRAYNTIIFNVLDANDHEPVFDNSLYHVTVADNTKIGSQIIQLKASDQDSGDNGKIKYFMQMTRESRNRRSRFWIDENTGIIYTNESLSEMERDDMPSEFTIIATDSGHPAKSSRTVLWIDIRPSESELMKLTSDKFLAEVEENAKPGTLVTTLHVEYDKQLNKNLHYHYTIISGNDGGHFALGRHSGKVLVAKPLDYEKMSSFKLQVTAECITNARCKSSAQVIISIRDINDNVPRFANTEKENGSNEPEYHISVSENKVVGSNLLQIDVLDRDTTTNSIEFEITSGNDGEKFEVNSKTGMLTLKQALDYDHVSSYRLVILIRDKQIKTSSGNLAVVNVNIEDENEHSPMFILQGQRQFPKPQYLEFVAENEPIGTTIFIAKAVDLDKGIYGKLNYSIVENEMQEKFHVDQTTGLVSTRTIFDYENKNRYYFTLKAIDAGGLSSTVRVQVEIESRDEYAPQFAQKSYKFIIPSNAAAGYVIGVVEAIDQDQGTDGLVIYQLSHQNPIIGINKTSGALILKQSATSEVNGSIVIVASSGHPASKSAKAFVGLAIGDYSDELEMASTSSVTSWVVGLLLASFILVLLCCTVFMVLHLRQKRQNKNGKTDSFNNSAFDTLEYAQSTMLANNSRSVSLYGPQYSDLADLAGKERRRVNNTVSELSDQSHSASSGRGSAEDGEEVEDEEIRMINEGIHQKLRDSIGIPDSGIHGDEDSLSQNSAKNTQEYLARLGIVPKVNHERQHCQSEWNSSGVQDSSLDNLCSFEGVDGSGDALDISQLIYSQIPEDLNASPLSQSGDNLINNSQQINRSLSSIVHSEEEITGSYNWDYLLDWGPQYQPLAHVFSEIARLKDDASTKSDAHYAGLIGRHSSPGSQSSGRSRRLLGAPNSRTSQTKAINNSRPTHCAINPRPGPLPPLPNQPRSPISYDSTFASGPMSPSFSPALSPLARSPTMSMIGVIGPPSIRTSQFNQNLTSDSEMKM